MSSIEKSVSEEQNLADGSVESPVASTAQSANDGDSIEARVTKLVFEQLGTSTKSIESVSQITPSLSFVNDLSADSLDTVELVMSLEEEFGIEIVDEEAENIRTVEDAIVHVKNKVALSGAAASVSDKELS